MARFVSIHSFRGGTGKSNLTANLAAAIALEGRRVGIVDTDIQSPGIHVLFGLDEDNMGSALNDYLWGRCTIEEAAHDVSAVLGEGPGAIFLVPSSIRAGEIARVLHEGYDAGTLTRGLESLSERLDLDVLLVDTHPGLNEETLLSIVLSDVLVILLRPDRQDYQGTAVTVDVARQLEVPDLVLVVNKVPSSLDHEALRARVESTYDAPVAGVFGLTEDMADLASAGIFCLIEPDHPYSREVRAVARRIQG